MDESILEDIERLSMDESLDAPITEAELDESLNDTKTGKGAGPDGVLPEILVHGGNRLKALNNNLNVLDDRKSSIGCN